MSRWTDLLVGIHQDERILELVLVKDGVEFSCRRGDALRVTAINNVNNRLRVRVVAPPVRTNAGLSTKIPDLELDIFICYRLDVETDRCSANAQHRLSW